MQNPRNENVPRIEDILRIATLLWYDVIETMTKTIIQAATKPPLKEIGKPRPIKIRWWKP